MKTRPLYRFVVMMFLVMFGIWTFGSFKPQPLSSLTQKEKFWATKAHAQKKYNLIFSGDSRVYRGIDPKTISKELGGLKVLNFGFSSGGHNPLIFKELEKRLIENSENKAIVLGLTPFSLTPKAQENSHFKQEIERDEKEILLRRYVNPALNFFDPVKPFDLCFNTDSTQRYFERFREDGWVESKKTPYNSEEALKSYKKNFKNNRIDEAVVQQVLTQVKKWTTKEIQVFAIRMPTTKKMELLENERSGYDEKVLKKMFEEVGGRWIEFEDRYRYKSYDGSHLDGDSARRVSSFLGIRLSKYLD